MALGRPQRARDADAAPPCWAITTRAAFPRVSGASAPNVGGPVPPDLIRHLLTEPAKCGLFSARNIAPVPRGPCSLPNVPCPVALLSRSVARAPWFVARGSSPVVRAVVRGGACRVVRGAWCVVRGTWCVVVPVARDP
jgi:hypothetical protein